MTISRVKPGGWGVNEELTSAQATALDVNAASALDKRSGQSDVCASNVTFSGTASFTGSAIGGPAAVPAWSSTTTLNVATANVFLVLLGAGNTTLLTSGVPVSGAFYAISFQQDASVGGHTLTWGGTVTFNFGSISNQPDTGISKETMWLFACSGTAFFALARNVVI